MVKKDEIKREKEEEKFVKPEIGKEDSWSEDQKKRGYYYDDACGYEIYKADEDEEPNSDEII